MLEKIFFAQARVGKGKKIFKCYKLRTMNGQRLALEDYADGISNGAHGKFENDPRITRVGKVLRKYWIDELPQFINVLKGDMKLVGVRPLSRRDYLMLPHDWKDARAFYKPGMIGAVYADKADGHVEKIASEKRYLRQYAEKPLRTDIKYFFKAMYNILIKGTRGV